MRDERTMHQLGEDLAVIRTELKNLNCNFIEFKNDNKSIVGRINDIENRQISTSEKVSNLAVFQSVFSIVIGAIATYLGVSRK
jgi:hypothetical protein